LIGMVTKRLPGVDEDRHAPAAADRAGLSPVLKLSREIADLAGSEEITQAHLAEALQYRPKLDLM
jgi:hypothetical protein